MAENPKDVKKSAGDNDSKTKLLNLMRFWLVGTFVIVWGATFAYIGMFTNRNIGATFAAGWPIWVITLALCIIAYVGYTIDLNRKFK